MRDVAEQCRQALLRVVLSALLGRRDRLARAQPGRRARRHARLALPRRDAARRRSAALLDVEGSRSTCPSRRSTRADGTGGEDILLATGRRLAVVARLDRAARRRRPLARCSAATSPDDTLLRWPRRSQGRRARAHDRLARVRRQRRRAPERLRRLRPPRAAGRPVRARVTKVKRGFAEALATEVLEPSAQRVEAPCAHYPACGGCRFQDLDYAEQPEAKAAQLRDALSGSAAIAEPPLEPIVPASSPFFYRNKMEYSFTQTAGRADARLPQGGPLGRGARGRALLAHDRPRQRDPERRARLGARGRARRVRPGRSSAATCATSSSARAATPGQALVHARDRPRREVRDRLLRRGAAPLPRGALDPLGGERHARGGDEPAVDAPLGRGRDRGGAAAACASASGPNAFLQTNTEMAERLYGLAREYAAADGSARRSTTSTAARARSGSRWRQDALSVWGVEISEESVACALENAELNGIGNAAFFAGNVGQSLEELRGPGGKPDVVVVDPPRAGLAGKALRRPGALEAPRIVYVSCNPTTLASDVKVLRPTTATSSCARGPWTCSRTRRTSRRSRCSSASDLRRSPGDGPCALGELLRRNRGPSPARSVLDAIALAPRADSDDRALVAIDLGCGDGTETRELLARGWTSSPSTRRRRRSSSSSSQCRRRGRPLDRNHRLVQRRRPASCRPGYAGLALPFCDPERFRTLWPRITSAIRDDGWFAGHFFGPRDSWAGNPGMTFLPVEARCSALLIAHAHRTLP